MKNLLSKIIILSAFIALFISCTSHDEMAPVAANPTITSIWPLSGGYGSTVVITGTNFSTTAANNKVTINGVDATVTAATATQLSVTVPACGGNGTVNVSTGSATATGPTFTYIPDVFAVGRDGKYAMLWKNGVATALNAGPYAGEATSVFVVGGDVYVAGYEHNGNKVVAKVWKNGVPTALTDGSKDAEATSLYVVGNDVYVGGYDTIGNNSFVTVWKNGVAMNLGTTDAVVRSLFVVGSDLYAAGLANGIPTVWKNGNATTLANSGYINSIYVSGTDVYVAGTDGNRSKVWKNGVATALTDGTKYANGNSVFLYGSDVYVGGNEDPFTIGNNPTYKTIAKVWKNGVATNLTNGSGTATVISIVVR
ncbi:IPT/TIG domain-containing protein [Flavobacterium sp.]|uniref:IPT/TIG domain-containing protein n=1 Tax=Flavobacterium sp. TaxID=239 RepID=UPI0026244C29|nr:IPT/TIG domain-containing protein [Flavobacterium sp.]